MPVDLEKLLAPGDVAVVIMEVQRGIVGDRSGLPQLREAAEQVGLFDHLRRLNEGARRAGVPVVHHIKGPEAVPSAPPLYPGGAAMAKRKGDMDAHDMEAAHGVPRLPGDIVVERHHGVSAFTGTELDSVLRRLDVHTVVAAGVSLNVGILTLAAEAVSRGYRTVVASDAVVGVPVDFGLAVLDNAIPFLATRLTTDEIVAIWDRH